VTTHGTLAIDIVATDTHTHTQRRSRRHPHIISTHIVAKRRLCRTPTRACTLLPSCTLASRLLSRRLGCGGGAAPTHSLLSLPLWRTHGWVRATRPFRPLARGQSLTMNTRQGFSEFETTLFFIPFHSIKTLLFTFLSCLTPLFSSSRQRWGRRQGMCSLHPCGGSSGSHGSACLS
jgi:hypothetical protein